jgi:hypothetical protein
MDRLDHLFLKFLHKHSKAYSTARPAEQYSESKEEDYTQAPNYDDHHEDEHTKDEVKDEL